MKKYILLLMVILPMAILLSCNKIVVDKTPVDYVNPYIGNISHLLVPTFPTVHLPNSLLRIYPERRENTTDYISGLPVVVTSHRGRSAFSISPKNGQSDVFAPIISYTYDNERITPYRYSVYLDEAKVEVDFAPSHQSALYNFKFANGETNQLIINSRNGKLKTTGCGVSGYETIGNGDTKIYLYLEAEQPVAESGVIVNNEIHYNQVSAEGQDEAVVLGFSSKVVNVR